MISAALAVHQALYSRLSSLVSLPVRVSPTAELPYVRLDGDTETPTGQSKQGEASTVRPIISVFSSDFGEAMSAAKTIADDIALNGLTVPGYRVIWARVEQTLSVPEVDTEVTIYGRRILPAFDIEPAS